MICNECNSEPYDVIVKEELGFEIEAIELDLDTPYCPFCGTDIALAQRGGFDAEEYDDNRLDT
tara:strand:+ start:67 stop:255 length:189 start_codon:yes stop_codon:yes gene_type:complete